MGVGISTPRPDAHPEEQREHCLAVLVGNKQYDLSSSFWEKLLLVQPGFQWPPDQVQQACKALEQNNETTRHLPKLLVHLAWSLQALSSSPATKSAAVKVINATYFSRVFLKYMFENCKPESMSTHLSLQVNDHEAETTNLAKGDLDVPSLVVYWLLSYIGSSDINPYTYMLHLELVNLLLVMMSTQLHSGPSWGVHSFLDAAILQESGIVGPFVRKLVLSFIARTPLPSEAINLLPSNESGVIQKMSSAAATVFMLPYYTYTYLLRSGDRFSKFPLADNSLLLLLVLMHHGKSVPINGDLEAREELGTVLETLNYHLNPFRRALDCTRDTDFDIVDIEQNIQGVRIPFAALYDRLGMCLTEDAPVLLLYCLVHGNPAFLEYVLVRTDLDTLVLPMLQMLYDVSKKRTIDQYYTLDQYYMLLIIFLILSQDSTFNASVHKLILPGVPWYKERLLPGISLGSLMVVILIRIVKFNLSTRKDPFLNHNCLGVLMNMAPHMHQLNAYASQRLVSLFDVLAKKYNKLCTGVNISVDKIGQVEGFEDMPIELHFYIDVLRNFLEILNAILTYALPRNPEVIYALLHRQELFQQFKEHHLFFELLENIHMVLNFFNVRMDDQQVGEWSVERVLQVIIANARSWRGDGLKTFSQMECTYEENLHPEEFFLPYVWRLVVSYSSIDWDSRSISLFQPEVNPTPAPAIVDKSPALVEVAVV